MIKILIDPDYVYFTRHQDYLFQSALWYNQLLLSQWHSFFLTSGRMSLSYEKGTMLGDLYHKNILAVVPDPVQEILPIQQVMTEYLRQASGWGEKDFHDLINLFENHVKIDPRTMSPTWKQELKECKLPKGIFAIPMPDSEEKAVRFYDWFNEETGLSKMRELLGIPEQSIVGVDDKVWRQPYYVYRDVSFVLTTLLGKFPVLTGFSESFENHSYLSKLLQNFIDNSQIIKQKATIEKYEVVRDLIVPEVDLRSIEDVVKLRKDSRFKDLRRVINDISSKAPGDINTPQFVNSVIRQISSHFMAELNKKSSIKTITLNATGIELIGLAITALLGLPLPVGATVSILKEWKEKLERDKKWYTLLWSLQKTTTI